MHLRITAVSVAARLLAVALLSHQSISVALGKSFTAPLASHAGFTQAAASPPNPKGGNDSESNGERPQVPSANFIGPGPGWG